MKQLLVTMMILLLLSCEKEERHIVINHMKQNSMTAMTIPCHALIENGPVSIEKVLIDDIGFTEEFSLLYNKLQEPEKNNSIDTRIRILYHHGTQTDTICMGEYFGIMVNGQQKGDSPELLKLLKDTIYSKFSRDNDLKKYYKQKRKLKTGKD